MAFQVRTGNANLSPEFHPTHQHLEPTLDSGGEFSHSTGVSYPKPRQVQVNSVTSMASTQDRMMMIPNNPGGLPASYGKRNMSSKINFE